MDGHITFLAKSITVHKLFEIQDNPLLQWEVCYCLSIVDKPLFKPVNCSGEMRDKPSLSTVTKLMKSWSVL